MDIQRSRLLWIAATILVVAVGIAILMSALGWTSGAVLPPFILATILVLAMVMLRGIAVHRAEVRDGIPLKDERTLYIEGRAGHYTTIAGAWFSLGLMWYAFITNAVFDMQDMGAVPALIIVTLFISLTNIVLRGYFGRKDTV